jgi:hypothetical protein
VKDPWQVEAPELMKKMQSGIWLTAFWKSHVKKEGKVADKKVRFSAGGQGTK